MKKKTTSAHLREWEAEQRSIMQALLGWDDDRYTGYQYDMAMEWLLAEFGADCPLINRIPEEKMFWSWWRLHWAKRDMEMIDIIDMLRPEEYETYYHMLHQPGSVYFRPHSAIMQRTYERMVTSIIKNHTSR